MGRVFNRAVMAVAVLALMASACSSAEPDGTTTSTTGSGSGETTTTAGEGTTTTAPPVQKDTLILSHVGEVDSLDPHQARRQEAQSLIYAVTEGLLDRDQETYQPAPQLAESWEQIDDLTWEFKLREGVTFTNGEPFNADVVIWNFERAVDPDVPTAIASGFSAVETVEKVDDYTVRFITSVPYPELLERMVRFRMLSPMEIESIGDEAAGLSVLGTGPYVFVEWDQANGEITLEENEDYWGDAPPFRTVTFRRVEEPATAVAQLISGEIDVVASLAVDQMDVVDSSGVAHTVSSPAVNTLEVRFDVMGRTSENPFQDLNVRLAANYAVDNVAIFEDLYGGLGVPLGSYLNPSIAGYDPSIPVYEHDPDRARELLADAGYADGFDTTMHVYPLTGIGDSQILGELIASYLTDVGIRTTIVPVGSAEVGPLIREGNAGPMILASNPAASAFDPGLANTFIRGAEGNMFAYYANDQVQALYEEAESILDQERRLEIYQEIQQIIHDEAPFIFLGSGFQLSGVRNEVEFTPSPDGLFRFLWASPAA